MFSLLLSTAAGVAIAGYGDVRDGRPTWEHRELITLTNAVRVDPLAWDYRCNTSSWSSSERSPKEPLYYHDGLTEIAQLHSEDMERHDFMDHTSWDGTSWSNRIRPYYPGGTLGENVAWGYRDNASALFDGWMCSSGHRSNIMSASFEDLGVGIEDDYYTQDFGGGARTPHVPVAMGVHTPERPSRDLTFLATWSDSARPLALQVETEHQCSDLSLTAGSAARGLWEVDLEAGSGCQRYRFVWETEGGVLGALPATGSYVYGQGCTLADPTISGACEPEEPEDPEPEEEDPETGTDTETDDPETGGEPGDCRPSDEDRNGDCQPDRELSSGAPATGCSAAPGPASAAWLLVLIGSLRRRSWRRPDPR